MRDSSSSFEENWAIVVVLVVLLLHCILIHSSQQIGIARQEQVFSPCFDRPRTCFSSRFDLPSIRIMENRPSVAVVYFFTVFFTFYSLNMFCSCLGHYCCVMWVLHWVTLQCIWEILHRDIKCSAAVNVTCLCSSGSHSEISCRCYEAHIHLVKSFKSAFSAYWYMHLTHYCEINLKQ